VWSDQCSTPLTAAQISVGQKYYETALTASHTCNSSVSTAHLDDGSCGILPGHSPLQSFLGLLVNYGRPARFVFVRFGRLIVGLAHNQWQTTSGAGTACPVVMGVLDPAATSWYVLLSVTAGLFAVANVTVVLWHLSQSNSPGTSSWDVSLRERRGVVGISVAGASSGAALLLLTSTAPLRTVLPLRAIVVLEERKPETDSSQL
jgi:hypothetical protein